MRHVHPLAWAGLALNLCIVLAMARLPVNAADAGLSSLEMQGVALVASLVPLLLGAVCVQAFALWYMDRKPDAGFILACASAYFLLPFSILYVVGAAFTLGNRKTAGLEPAGPERGPARAAFRAAPRTTLLGASAAMLLGSLALYASGNFVAVSLSISLLSFGTLALFFALRGQSRPALELGRSALVLQPDLFSRHLEVPYAALRRAALFADQSIRFEVQGGEGLREVRWSLKTVDQAERRRALEELGRTLQEHGVELV